MDAFLLLLVMAAADGGLLAWFFIKLGRKWIEKN